MIPTILGGIGLFLLGMVLMTEGLKSAAGDALRQILARLTGGPVRAMFSGAGMTMLVQSSSATTLATIGFVSAGLLTFQQAIGLVFGAAVGTTSTGWIVSLLGLKLKFGAIALPLIGVGALARLLLKGRAQALGLALAGFGLIFVGIDTLSTGMEGLADRIDPRALGGEAWYGRLLLVAIGIAMSVVMQSSSAAIATTLTALHSGAIGLADAATLVIGQNVGTAVTSAIASIGASVPAKRTALAHVLFNAFAGIVAFAVLPLFLWTVSPAGPGFEAMGDAALIAGFHTTFNVLAVALVIPFTTPFADRISRWIPERGPVLTRLLDPSVASLPSVAVDTARRTVLDIAAVALDVVREALGGTRRPDSPTRLAAADRALVDTREFLQGVRTSAESGREHQLHISVLHAIDHLDRLVAAAGESGHSAGLQDGAIREWAGQSLEGVASAREWVGAPDGTAPITELREISRTIADARRGHRQDILKRTAAGEVSPLVADRQLDAMRWVDRLAYHVWRAMHHLYGEPSPEIGGTEVFEEGEEEA